MVVKSCVKHVQIEGNRPQRTTMPASMISHKNDIRIIVVSDWIFVNSICGICRAAHTVAITPDDVISWGCNSDGQTGQGERAEPGWVKPRSLKPLQGLFVTQVVCGRFHTLCVTATSQVSLPAAEHFLA